MTGHHDELPGKVLKPTHEGVGYKLQRGGGCASACGGGDAMRSVEMPVVLLLAEVLGFEELLKKNDVGALSSCSARQRFCFVRVGGTAATASKLSGSDFHVHTMTGFRATRPPLPLKKLTATTLGR